MWTLVCFLVGQTDVPDEQIALLKCIPYDRLSPSVVRDLVLQHELIKKYSLVVRPLINPACFLRANVQYVIKL
jgi:hypothetical protein